MIVQIGVILALVAMLFWGIGDFLIQRSTRKFGDWETLFFITLFGAVALTPFVYKDIANIAQWGSTGILLLVASAIVLLLAALLEFESLKKGKLSIVEPIWSLEIPASALLAFIILREVISSYQIILIGMLIAGLILISLRSYHLTKRIWLEKAALLALFAALMMGAANFFIGWGSRETTVLLTKWFVDATVALISFVYLFYKKRIHKIDLDFKSNKKLLLSMCIFDNLAWVAFGFALVLAPISIAVAISESYIIITVLLGLFVNKEKLKYHQKIGLIIAVLAAIILASTL